MFNSKLVLFDMDDTVFDFIRPLLESYNKKYSSNIQIEDLIEYNTITKLPCESGNIFSEFVDDNFIMAMNPFLGSVECITRVNKKHNVVFATSGHPITIPARHQLLKKTFDFYDDSMLWRLPYKNIINNVVLVDDCPYHFEDFKGYGIMPRRPWNKNYQNNLVEFASGWNEVYKLI